MDSGQQVELGMYSVHTLARRLGKSEKFVYKHLRRLPGLCRVGRSVMFDRAAVERRIAGGEVLLPVKCS